MKWRVKQLCGVVLTRVAIVLVICLGGLGCQSKPPEPIDRSKAQHKQMKKLGVEPKEIAPFWTNSKLLDGVLPPDKNRDHQHLIQRTSERVHDLCKKHGISLAPPKGVLKPRTVLESAKDLALGAKSRRGRMPEMSEFELATTVAVLWRRQGYDAQLYWRRKPGGRWVDASWLKVQIVVGFRGQEKGVALDVSAKDGKKALVSDLSEFKPLSDVEAIGLYHAKVAGFALIHDNRVVSKRYSQIAYKLAPSLPMVAYTHALVLEHHGEFKESAKILSDMMDSIADSSVVRLAFARVLRKSGQEHAANWIIKSMPVVSSVDLSSLAEAGRLAARQLNYLDALMLFEMVYGQDPRRWEVIFDAALIGLVAKDKQVLSAWVARGQRAQPTSPLWDRLHKAGQGEQWHDSLLGRAVALGVVQAKEVPLKPAKNQEQAPAP